MESKAGRILVASAVAGLLAMGGMGGIAEAAGGEGDTVKCYGVNTCKGTGACGGKGHSCAGKNACKGQGYLELEKEACLTMEGGRLTSSPQKNG